MLINIVYILFILLAVLAVVVAMQPSVFKITRSALINAPAEKIFPHVNNLRSWHDWSPWARLDPNAVTTYEGPVEGAGAIMRWNGNNQIGQGSMTIVDGNANERIGFQLDFLKPMKATNMAHQYLLKNTNLLMSPILNDGNRN